MRDSEILKTIEPNVLEAHLRTFGWHEQGRIHDNAGAIWRRKNDPVDDEFEILLPLQKTLGDYAARISDALKTLEVVENRSQLEILSDLLTSVANQEIQGMVIKVPSNLTGYFTLIGVVLGKLREILVQLNESKYHLAFKSYQEHLPIVCTGDLIKENGEFVLKNPRNFKPLSASVSSASSAVLKSRP
ncbi:hypothetical protein [Iningainema tapete]|uniref:Uncharacterized protein n=1 Tax=Iningainema tapete BLCC-T55 TaxID=2748662 RepID=A0A8J6XLX5_9CYAN|nr:hypothetical protein [Iningainema tapete]MBD2777218.1 hypothetical protein [Iningainema tapete BLCC-T55]